MYVQSFITSFGSVPFLLVVFSLEMYFSMCPWLNTGGVKPSSVETAMADTSAVGGGGRVGAGASDSTGNSIIRGPFVTVAFSQCKAHGWALTSVCQYAFLFTAFQ